MKDKLKGKKGSSRLLSIFIPEPTILAGGQFCFVLNLLRSTPRGGYSMEIRIPQQLAKEEAVRAETPPPQTQVNKMPVTSPSPNQRQYSAPHRPGSATQEKPRGAHSPEALCARGGLRIARPNIRAMQIEANKNCSPQGPLILREPPLPRSGEAAYTGLQ